MMQTKTRRVARRVAVSRLSPRLALFHLFLISFSFVFSFGIGAMTSIIIFSLHSILVWNSLSFVHSLSWSLNSRLALFSRFFSLLFPCLALILVLFLNCQFYSRISHYRFLIKCIIYAVSFFSYFAHFLHFICY